MIVDGGDDHQFVGLACRDHRLQLLQHRRRAADEQPRAVARDGGALAVRIGIGQRLLDAGQRQILAAIPAQAIEIHRRREALGLGVGFGRYHGDGENAVRRRTPARRLEMRAVIRHRFDRVISRKMMRKREAHADLRGQFRAVVAGAEQPDRRQRRIVGHRHHIVVGMAGRKIAGLPQRQFVQPFEEVVALAAIEPAAQRVRGGAIGARRAAEAEIDPAGKQRLQHLEALRHHQRRMVGQHHAAGADPDAAGHRGDLPDHQVGRRARHRGQVVMLGQPVADVAQRVRMARQIDAVAQRRGRAGARGDDGEVEDRERDHGRLN